MVSAIDMGLDDIIKSNKKAKKAQATTARGKGRGGRGRGSTRGRGGNRANGARNARNNQGTLRRTRGGGVGQRRGNRGFGRANGSMMRSARPAANGRGMGGIRGRGARGRGGRGGRGLTRAANGGGRVLPGKITVRNLQWSVSDDDIKELFSQFGELKTSAIHYDRTGRSLGVADITFRRSTDADKACNKYNNVPLDGRPMKIEVVGKKPVAPVSTRLGAKPKQQQQQQQKGKQQANGRGGGARRGRGRGRGGQGRPRQPKKEISAAELDSQLEAYISNKMDVE